MKRLALSAALLGVLATPAFAQINVVPQIGVNSANIRENTYIGVMNALVPAASATDFFCITGAAGKNVHVRSIQISGTAGTLITTPISIRRLALLDTGTTSLVVTGPRSLNTTNAAAQATVVGYDSTSTNPTVNDGSPQLIATSEVTLGVSGTTAAGADRLIYSFGTALDSYTQGLDIPSGATTTEYCLNLGAVSVSTGKLNGQIIWTEN